jgi:uncharacterized membrane protein
MVMLNRIKRVLRHRWLGLFGTRLAISPDLQLRLQQRVAASERRHSGEIRICIELTLPPSYLWRDAALPQITRQRALSMFSKLRVWDTTHNNGVLIYLLLAERSIELVADRGLSQVVEPQVWHSLVSRLRAAFQQGQFEAGLTQALAEVSALLVERFPRGVGEETNPNELPDAPVLI